MGTRLKGRLSLLFLSFVAVMLIFPAMAFAQGAPTIQSDKDDYRPGETVTLTGSDWQPGESVHIYVNDDEGKTWERNADVTADANGAIRDEFQLPDWFVATYKVIATGEQSGVATTTFTDGNVVVTSAPVATGANEVKFQLKYTIHKAASGSDNNCTPDAADDAQVTEPNLVGSTTQGSGKNDWNKGVAATHSVRLEAAATASQPSGWTFKEWTGPTTNPPSFFVIDSSNPRVICVTGDFTRSRDFQAVYQAPQAPVANNDSYNVNEDNTLNIAAPGVLGNDTDANGDTLTAVKVSNPANGSVTLNSNGSFTYTPNANFNGSDSFTYKANDGSLDSNTATVNITINAVNDAPVAVDDTAATDEDTAAVINVVVNDTDADGNSLSVVSGSVSTPANGTAELITSGNDAGKVRYTPNGNFHGTDSFKYKVSDGTAQSNEATVSITVRPINDAPKAENDTAETDEDTPAKINVLFNDTDVDGDSLSVVANSLSDPANGSVELITTGPDQGKVLYTPDANYNGSDSFTYKASDGTAQSNLATVSITVKAVNDAPKAENDTAETDEDTAKDIDVLANDEDVENDSLSVSSFDATSAQGGTVTQNPNGTLKYEPKANVNGNDSFTYKATDGSAESNPATVSIKVNAVNDAPKAENDSYEVDEDNTLTVLAADGVLKNDTDVENDALTAAKVSDPAHGSVTLNANGSFTYTPNANFNGNDSFTYKANDGAADSNEATVSIKVNPVNDAPKAEDDSAETDEDTAAVIDVLFNDTDVDGDALSVVANSLSDPANGSVELITSGDDEGKVLYTPDENFFGNDSFTYKASDGTVQSNEATVSITVKAVNDAPVAKDDSYTTDEDTDLVVSAANGLLKNDEDVEDDALHVADGNADATDGISPVSGPSHGQVTLNANGSFTYKPDPNFFGNDSFTYKVCDNGSPQKCSVETAEVKITINPVNDAPVANGDSYEVDEDNTLTVLAADGVLKNDTDVENDALTAAKVSDPAHGSVTLNANGSFTYTPQANYNGNDSFTYKANDGTDNSNVATVSITVKSVNDAPVANGDTAETDEDTPANIDVLFNDTDVDGDTLSVSSFTQPAHGTVSENPNGTLKYEPEADFNGNDSFTYKATDGTAESDWATVSIKVNAVNDAPKAEDDEATTPEDTPLVILPADLLGNDSAGPADESGQKLTITEVSNPVNGEVSLGSDGKITFTPDPNFYGQASFDYTVCDNGSPQKCSVETATVRVTVSPVNDAPVANGDSYEVDEDNTLTVLAADGVLKNDTDVENDALTAAKVSDPAHGSVTLNANGSFTYTPQANYNGNDSFTYKANDGTDNSNVATVSITVKSVNDDPTVKTPAADDTGKNEGATLSTQGAFQDAADPNDTLTITKTAGAGTVVDNGDGTWSWSLPTRDNISGSVTVTASDGKGGTATDTFDYSTVNVNPMASNGTFLFNPVLGTATAAFSFSDAGFDDTHSKSYFTWSDIGNQQAFSVTETNGAGQATSVTRTLAPGCYPNLTVTGTAVDDDNGASAPLTIYSPNPQTSVYAKGFRPPIMDNERNIAKYGNVVPVKVQLTNPCTGGTVTNESLYITVAKGLNGEFIEDTNIVAESVSAADTGSQMRVVDGGYMYNLSTKNLTANTNWAVRVRLGSTTGPVILQAVLYPKK